MKLNATKRTEIGKQARRLRRAGRIPAVIYGHHAANAPVAIDRREFEQVFKRSGHTQLVDLAIDGGRAHKVLIKEIQIHPRWHGPVHVDLLQVSLREKLQVQVPVVLTGEAPAVERGDADVLHVLHQLRVECLPADIPEAIVVDIAGLTEVGDQLRVADLAPIENVTVLDDPEDTVVKASPRRELAAELEAEEAAEAAEAAEGAEPEVEAEAEAGAAAESEPGPESAAAEQEGKTEPS